MAIFLVIVLAIWVCAMAGWWLFSSAFRHADVDKLKSRLLGTTKPERDKKSQQAPALIQTEQKSGYIATRIVQRFELQAKLHNLLEQAGMKWTPTRLVNIC